MAEYMLMVLEDEGAHAKEAPKAIAELIEKRSAFAADLRRAGVLRDSAQLRPSKEGKRLRRGRDQAELDVRAGPFADDGKALGAYYWVDVPDVEHAAKLAASCPALATDEVDVRPLMKGRVDAGKEAKPGKLFACAVLGNTATEEAWVGVMDQIDAATRNALDGDSFPGGVRLEPPRTGRRVATRGDRRATFDGPFLESKEVIGGVFLVRMPTIDDVVRWAADTGFVVHGLLEIRELWRT